MNGTHTLLPVYMSCDDNYVVHLCVVIASILNNTKSRIHFIVLAPNLSGENKQKIATACGSNELSIVNTSIKLNNFSNVEIKCGHISLSACSRFFIPKLDFPYEKGIYLDCDVVVNGDIKELFDIDLGENYAAAVDDFVSAKHAAKFDSLRYFNSGVLLLNINKMRKDNLTEVLVGKLNELKHLIRYIDQDILNLVFGKKVVFLPPRFGVVSPYFRGRKTKYFSKEEISAAIYNPLVIHFTGPDKPWVIPCGLTAHPWTPLYFHYLRQTPFAHKAAEYFRTFNALGKFFWYWKRHITFFLRPQFYSMRLLYLKNKRRFNT